MENSFKKNNNHIKQHFLMSFFFSIQKIVQSKRLDSRLHASPGETDLHR